MSTITKMLIRLFFSKESFAKLTKSFIKECYLHKNIYLVNFPKTTFPQPVLILLLFYQALLFVV